MQDEFAGDSTNPIYNDDSMKDWVDSPNKTIGEKQLCFVVE